MSTTSSGRFHSFWLAFCLAILVLPWRGTAAARSGMPTVVCRISAPSIAAGAQADFYLEIRNVQNLYGVELTLGYDPNLIEFLDADLDRELINMTLGDFLSPDVLMLDDISEPGTFLFNLTQIDPTPARSGDGILAHGVLVGREIGTVDFTLADVTLYNVNFDKIEHQIQNCSVEVTQGAPPGAVEAQPSTTPTLTPMVEASISPTPTTTATATTSPTSAGQPQPPPTSASVGTSTLVPSVAPTVTPSATAMAAQVSVETPSITPTNTATIAPASAVAVLNTNALTLSLPYISNAMASMVSEAPLPTSEPQAAATAEPGATTIAEEQPLPPLVVPGDAQATATATPLPQSTAQPNTPSLITQQQLQLSALTGPMISLAWLFPLGFTLAGLGFLGLIIATIVYVSSRSAS